MASNIHTTSTNAVTLVWGSLRLTPIIYITLLLYFGSWGVMTYNKSTHTYVVNWNKENNDTRKDKKLMKSGQCHYRVCKDQRQGLFGTTVYKANC